ncbi:enoyl-CoA hydratase/isomerase family protein [Noviherbaspirillum aridicola]|uniref:3-hydroxyisobutyryl-CoA hydrolase n=1 Tax=Noviherbaspirillum aridicola TaxID=2849687 RepID=A0ABQ4Q894_9BURK|nr:enoyl-CoA hydratase/isomerase family protein [Noviherbaspirillum aridicola]GIZ53433.1 3-hydroxyisobutyryl-CoA hydrolase [Noviherbaspirillum aridicola]
MTQHLQAEVRGRLGLLTLDRPKALNSLSLDMVRALTAQLLAWREDAAVHAVLIRSSSDRAFCAGGDIRFFHDAGRATPGGGSTLLEDFFSEEYALNHLIHFYPKPYIALMDGIVMGGGMGVAQAGPDNRMRVVTERTKMAMPEVNIGLFPDVGGSHFLARTPGCVGAYLGVTGETISAADALYAGLADVFIPAAELETLIASLAAHEGPDMREAVRGFAAPFRDQCDPAGSTLSAAHETIDRCFGHDNVPAILAALAADSSPFAQKTAEVMRKRSPLMMCVTLEQLRRGASMSVAECLRMERNMVRRSFEYGEVLEGIRALVIDKDNAPQWNPGSLEEVDDARVAAFFAPPWPDHAHPLRDLA